MAAELVHKDNITGMEFIHIKGGCFTKGESAGDGDSNERPVHRACVSDFHIGKTKVTNEQFKKFEPGHSSGKTRSGGTIIIVSSSNVSINDSTISNNRIVRSDNISTSDGGISFFGENAGLEITNTTISGNQAASPFSYGGGVDMQFGSEDYTITINQANSAENEVSSLAGSTNRLYFRYSIIGHSGISAAESLNGDFDATSSIFTNSDGDTPTALNNILGPLADNGGRTQPHVLPPNRPDIDAATEGTVFNLSIFELYAPGCRGEEIVAERHYYLLDQTSEASCGNATTLVTSVRSSWNKMVRIAL